MPEYDEATRRLGAAGPSVCALVQDMLPFYLDDDLTKDSRAYIDDHLATCERCASFLAGGRSVQEHLRRDTSVRPPRRATEQARTDDIVTRGRRRVLGYALLGAGIVVFLVMFGFGTSRHSMSVQEAVPPMAVPPVGVVGSDTISVPAAVHPVDGEATPTPVPMSMGMQPMSPDIAPPADIPLPPTMVPTPTPAP